MNSRERILNRLRQQQSEIVADPLSVPTDWAQPERADWMKLLQQNLEDNHAEVMLSSEKEWKQELAARLISLGIKRLLCGNNAKGQMLVQYLTDSVPALSAGVVSNEIDKSDLFHNVDAGFSVASAALAETGSLVVETGATEPRTLSLAPPLNIILLQQSQLYANFSAYVGAVQMPVPMPTNLLLISGPSKTADIQQTLAYGAHGPKSLIIVVLTDA